MKLSVSKSYSFDAAHRIAVHPGKCKRLHGHTYRVEVEVSGKLDTRKGGMILDFDELDASVESAIEQLDHRYLNNVLEDDNVTAEKIALWFSMVLVEGGDFLTALPENIRLERVTVYETPTSAATWRA